MRLCCDVYLVARHARALVVSFASCCVSLRTASTQHVRRLLALCGPSINGDDNQPPRAIARALCFVRSDAVELLAAVGCGRALRGAWQLRARGGRAAAAERLEAVAARVDASGVGPLERDALPMALQLGPGEG